MTRFIDQYAPPEMPGWPVTEGIRFSTQLATADSGDEQANRRWQHPLRRFTMPEAVRDQAIYEAVRNQWLIMGGPFHTWPWRNPLDFASRALIKPNMVPTIKRTDQVIGQADGAKTRFQLSKTYTRGIATYQRDIILPIVSTVVVGVGGVDPATLSPAMTFTVTRPGGAIEFNYPPSPGLQITAGFLFDCIVRFETDDAFEGIAQTYGAGGFADLVLYEVRACL